MDNIEKKLAQLNLEFQDLPETLQKLMTAVDYQTEKLNEQVKIYEERGVKDLKIEMRFEESFALIESKENYIITKLDEYKEKLNSQEVEKVDKTESTAPLENKPKKKIGFGTFIIGGAILALTLGAVNIMKSR